MAGLGIAYLPDFAVREAIGTDTLVPVLDEFVAEGGKFSILWPGNRHVAAQAESLRGLSYRKTGAGGSRLNSSVLSSARSSKPPSPAPVCRGTGYRQRLHASFQGLMTVTPAAS